jgi:hypothetical protein
MQCLNLQQIQKVDLNGDGKIDQLTKSFSVNQGPSYFNFTGEDGSSIVELSRSGLDDTVKYEVSKGRLSPEMLRKLENAYGLSDLQSDPITKPVVDPAITPTNYNERLSNLFKNWDVSVPRIALYRELKLDLDKNGTNDFIQTSTQESGTPNLGTNVTITNGPNGEALFKLSFNSDGSLQSFAGANGETHFNEEQLQQLENAYTDPGLPPSTLPVPKPSLPQDKTLVPLDILPAGKKSPKLKGKNGANQRMAPGLQQNKVKGLLNFFQRLLKQYFVSAGKENINESKLPS